MNAEEILAIIKIGQAVLNLIKEGTDSGLKLYSLLAANDIEVPTDADFMKGTEELKLIKDLEES